MSSKYIDVFDAVEKGAFGDIAKQIVCEDGEGKLIFLFPVTGTREVEDIEHDDYFSDDDIYFEYDKDGNHMFHGETNDWIDFDPNKEEKRLKDKENQIDNDNKQKCMFVELNLRPGDKNASPQDFLFELPERYRLC